MKTTLLICLISFFIEAQTGVTNEVLQNVFMIKHNLKTATCFRITNNNKDYLVTAKHLFKKGIKNKTPIDIEIRTDTGWMQIHANLLIHKNNSIDIAILDIKQKQMEQNLFDLKGEYYISQACYFIGYPYGFKMEGRTLNYGFSLPFVKAGIISAVIIDSVEDITKIYLDAHNNYGFSGGPVVVEIPNKTNQRMRVIGVVTAYLKEEKPIKTPFGQFENHENTGIVVVYSIRHVKEILENQ